MKGYPDNKKATGAKKRGAGPAIVAGFSVAIAIFLGIGAIMFLRSLFSPWWIPVAATAAAALIPAVLMRKVGAWVTGSPRTWLNILCCFIITYPVLLFAAMLVNRVCASGEPHYVTASVDRVYKETRYRRKRVTRRVYRREPYKAYVIATTLSDGEKRNFDIPYSTYKVTEKGDTVDIPVVKGALGMMTLTSFDNHDIKPRHPKTGKSDRRTKFFGTSGSGPHSRHSAQEVARRHRERIDSIRRKYHPDDDDANKNNNND